MPASTTNMAISYPLTADKMSDYPTVAQSAAETIDAALAALGSGTWTNLTLSAGWSAVAGGRTPQARLVGNTVYIRGAVTGASGASWASFATLPAGMRPAAAQFLGAQIAIIAGVGAGAFGLHVATTGVLSCPSGFSAAGSGAVNSVALDSSFSL